ncbi:MAG TPA: AtpZ/AtpI family protein [Dehalococcoidia bacterium]|nr:AtpZ/AtpI family protein [Dehalococcoidia bacterium]
MIQYTGLRTGAGAEAYMSRWMAALRLVGVGFFIGGSIVLGVVAGIWLDGRLNTGPSLAIVGLFLGIAVAFYGVYRMLIPLMKNKQNGEGG